MRKKRFFQVLTNCGIEDYEVTHNLPQIKEPLENLPKPEHYRCPARDFSKSTSEIRDCPEVSLTTMGLHVSR